jgi:ankyrin repeat protein
MYFSTRNAFCFMFVFTCATLSLSAQGGRPAGRVEAGDQGLTPLMRASARGQIRTVRALLRKGADVNEHDASGRTALGLAAGAGRLEVVKALLAAGADPNAKAFSFHAGEHSVLIAALHRGVENRVEIVDALLAAGAELNPKDAQITPLMFAANEKDVGMAEALLSRGADVNWKNYQGLTPLMAAVLTGSPEMVQLLIAKGADVNARDDSGRTALSLNEEMREESEPARRAAITRLLEAAGAKPKGL